MTNPQKDSFRLDVINKKECKSYYFKNLDDALKKQKHELAR